MNIRVGLVVPHIFMHQQILPKVIFSPAELAISLADGLAEQGCEVTLFTPGPVNTAVRNETADLSLFQAELDARGDDYLDLLKKHPLTFVSFARQVQAELTAKAYRLANQGELDIVHIYTNEEDIGLPFSELCRQPVVFTHHDPFNFLARYRSSFPKYKHLNWLSLSLAQRKTMPPGTNWVGNIYHGLDPKQFQAQLKPQGGYVAYLGRIIEPKGVHLAIEAVKLYNSTNQRQISLRIAGKHYAGSSKDSYWQNLIKPQIDDKEIQYVGYIKDKVAKQDFLSNAEALIVPSTFSEPFGLVMIEALACGTPLIGLASGAIPEIISDGKTGLLVHGGGTNNKTATAISQVISKLSQIKRQDCRDEFEARFTLERMCAEHQAVYEKLIKAKE